MPFYFIQRIHHSNLLPPFIAENRYRIELSSFALHFFIAKKYAIVRLVILKQ